VTALYVYERILRNFDFSLIGFEFDEPLPPSLPLLKGDGGKENMRA
jgi:hypothetical protein